MSTACLCPMCTAEPAYTYTEVWRRICEARMVLKKPKALRRIYCNEVLKERGEARALQLIADVIREGGLDAIEVRPETLPKLSELGAW